MNTKTVQQNSKKIPASISLTPELWEQIDGRAENQERSRNNMIAVMAKYYLANVEDISLVK